MNTELFIENYQADVSTDISALITFALDDLKDFSERTTSFSKTIVLPGTSRNNRLFGHIFRVDQANEYDPDEDNVNTNYNAAKSADCIIFQDQMQVFKGQLRLMEIIVDKGRPEYEVAVFGELAGLNVALLGSKLEDLDFSAYNHAWNDTNITASWNNTPGTGYYYPLIDYGGYSTLKADWDIHTFRPALYVREYIDKMFTAAGYRWESALFDTARFKSLIVPCNTKKLYRNSDYTFYVDAAAQSYDGVSAPLTNPTFTNHVLIVGSGFSANGSSTEFTATTDIIGSAVMYLTGTYTKSIGSTMTFSFMKNGVAMVSQSFGSGSASGSFTINLTANSAINNGDVISVEFSGPATYTIDITDGYIKNLESALVEVAIGDTVEINNVIPKNIRQVDFLVSIVKLFNLYVYEDKQDSRKIHFVPYVDFFSTDQNDAVDWTYKLNRDKPIRVKPMSELTAKRYEFKFKPDSDYYNELYKKRYNQGYGDYVYDSQYEFAEASKSLELIFSATPLVGYSGQDKVYSTIFKMSNSTEEQVDSNIRILQSKKITGVTSWSIKNGASTIISGLTSYGYAGHLDDPDAPSNDLNFGATRELFFTLASGNISSNQFAVYWSSYLAEVTDKDSKLVSGYFYLTGKDIVNLDFSKKVHVDGILYKLAKINDYNASNPTDCKVELLKINYLIY